jgi:basic amino acid/polyamine antiporter, APA family
VVAAALVVISGFGALNGWTMICAEMPLAAAKDGLFPDRFGRLSSRGVPVFGIVASTALASLAMVLSYAGTAGYTVFNTLVFMSGITAAIPYGFSALAQIKWRAQDNRKFHTPRFARDVTIAVVALVFSILFIWYSRSTGEETFLGEYLPFIFAGVAFLLGIPVYLAQRTRMSEPLPVPNTDRSLTRKADHAPPRRLRGWPAAAGDHPPARAGADQADAKQCRRVALRRRHVGAAGA